MKASIPAVGLLALLAVCGSATCLADDDTDTAATLSPTATELSLEKALASARASGSSESVCDRCGEPDSCCACCMCGPPGRFWVRQEYLGWWAKGGSTPTLVATSPNGALPATVPLYGNASFNDRFRSGTWTQAGMWFDCCQTRGLQGDYFFLGRQSSPFFASSDGDPVLTRPFIDATNGTPTEELIAFPGVVVGSVRVTNYNSATGAGASCRRNLCCWNDGCESDCDDSCGSCFRGQDCRRLDLVAGFRYYRFNDNLGVNERLTSIDPTSGVPIGTQFNVSDSFRTMNNFYGGEVGLIGQRYRDRWMVEGTVKVALGTMQQVVAINGSTVVSFPGQPPAVNQGGLLALSSNIGRYTHNDFAAIPQFSSRLGYRVSERFTLLAGYTFIYFGRVARAGDQIDTVVNPNLIPPPVAGGPNRPAFALHTSDLWLQGITLGGEIHF